MALFHRPVILVTALAAVVASRSITAAAASSSSSSRNTGGSWRPKCQQPPRKVLVAGGSTLTITSPNYPASYDYHTRCGWAFKPTSRNIALTLKCDTFDLQTVNNAGICQDYLKVHGTRYCGNNIPRTITATNVTRYRVIFHSNRRHNYKGFHCTVTASNPNTDHCSCGVRGQTRTSLKDPGVATAEFPWQAALVVANTSTPFCGASIIYERWVLTSAACAQRIKRNKCNYEVVVGTHNLSVATSEQTRHLIRKVVIHDGYDNDASRSKHNVALLHLKKAVTFQGRRALPICLPDPHTNYTDQPAILTTWAAETGGTAGEVRKTAARTLGRNSCALEYIGRGVTITADWLCTDHLANTSHQRLCQDALGSPLVTKRDDDHGKEGGRYVQVGVAAFHDDCSLPQDTHLPRVYTNLTKYLGWITKTVDGDNTCL